MKNDERVKEVVKEFNNKQYVDEDKLKIIPTPKSDPLEEVLKQCGLIDQIQHFSKAEMVAEAVKKGERIYLVMDKLFNVKFTGYATETAILKLFKSFGPEHELYRLSREPLAKTKVEVELVGKLLKIPKKKAKKQTFKLNDKPVQRGRPPKRGKK